jgi:hypothetical protein
MTGTARQARLTKALRDANPTIADMEFGRPRYTVPWAMWADRDELLWLHPDYEVTSQPMGTSSMRVELRDDGYHVWPVRGHGYKPQAEAGYVGSPSQQFIPVAALEGTQTPGGEQ